MSLLKYELFGDKYTDYAGNWDILLNILREDEGINVILNIGVGGPRPNGDLGSLAWNKLLFNEINAAERIFNLELDSKLCDVARNSTDVLLQNTFLGDVRNFNFDPAGIPHADLILWSHGPEHVSREEWPAIFARLEAMSTRGVILQMPGGNYYDYGEDHISKNIQKGELERLGYTVKYDGEWNSSSCGILAYKIKTQPDVNKIFVYGFPHSGTTIIRKLIGNNQEVHEFVGEVPYCPGFYSPEEEVTKDNIVFKLPIAKFPYDFYKTTHKDYKIVMIIKNPYDIFGSLYTRLGSVEYESHSIADWVKHGERFLQFLEMPQENVFTIKYEEMFSNNYQKIQEMFTFLGLSYTEEEIIHKKRDSIVAIDYTVVPTREPARQDHLAFRTWQTSQPFVDRTGKGAKYLPPHLRKYLTELPITKELGYI